MLCLSTLHLYALISHVKLTPGWVLIQVTLTLYRKLDQKFGVGAVLWYYGTGNIMYSSLEVKLVWDNAEMIPAKVSRQMIWRKQGELR